MKCSRQLPVVEALADQYEGRARIVKVLFEGERSVLRAFGVSGVPAYLFFRDGVEVNRLSPRIVGWRLEERMRSRIERALAARPRAPAS